MAMVDLSRLESNHESRWSSSRFSGVHFYYEWLACCWELPRESLIGIMMKIGEGRVSKGAVGFRGRYLRGYQIRYL